MIISLALVLLLQQLNPPGTAVAPSQAAFYSALGATAQVEVRNSAGQVISLTDTNGGKFSHVMVSFPAGIAVGLGWQLSQTQPGGYPLTALVPAQSSVCVTMISGSATESPVGTYDSSPGVGNGIASGFPAPDATTPTIFASGLAYTISPGSVIVARGSTGKTPVGKATGLLGSSMTGSSGAYASGGHSIARIVGDNASSTTLYLQVFDSATLPANGSTPIAEVTIGFGISTSPTENEESFTPDWIQTSTGVYFAWSTTPGSLTLAGSGTGLLVRIYGS
jgi:hypothetical protein